MSNFAAGWYLIYTRPRHEKKVSAHLAENNIPYLLPTRKVLRQWQDRRKYVVEPLFPSYVFVYIEDMRNYYCGSDAEGALYYVRQGNMPARVNEPVINNIRLVMNRTDEIEVSFDQQLSGKKMVICEGALTGLSCELVKVDSKERVLVRVDLLQRSLLVTLPHEHLTVV